MLLKTYEKIMNMFDKANGYLTTQELQAEKITMIQLTDLINMNMLERVTHGVYWRIDKNEGKPENYKYIELAKANSKSVVCAASALYCLGYIDVEPESVEIATGRTDRARMKVKFKTTRHYFSESAFENDVKVIETKYGNYRVYDVDRSVCDCIRLRDSMDPELFALIIKKYKRDPNKNLENFTAYADKMRFKNIALDYVTD